MLAKVLGANVMPHTAAIEEIGYYFGIMPQNKARRFLSPI